MPVLTHIHWIRIFVTNLRRFNIVLPSVPRSYRWSVPFRLEDEHFIYISVPCVLHKPSYIPWFHRHSNVLRLTMSTNDEAPSAHCPVSCHFLLCFFSAIFSLSLCHLLLTWSVKFHAPVTSAGKITLLYIIIVMFLNSRLEGRCYKANAKRHARNFYWNTISPNIVTCHIFRELVYRLSLYCNFVLEAEAVHKDFSEFRSLGRYCDVYCVFEVLLS
jgi:hypothetical protein